MEVQLLVKSDPDRPPRDYVFPLKERVVLGRSPESPVPLEGTAISREHFVLELIGDTIYATDLSNNGTWINGNRLRREERTQLKSGDSIQVPDHQISFQIRGTPAAASAVKREEPASASAVVPPGTPVTPLRTIEPETREAPSSATGLTRSLTLLDKWILLLALLAVVLIAYYGFLGV